MDEQTTGFVALVGTFALGAIAALGTQAGINKYNCGEFAVTPSASAQLRHETGNNDLMLVTVKDLESCGCEKGTADEKMKRFKSSYCNEGSDSDKNLDGLISPIPGKDGSTYGFIINKAALDTKKVQAALNDKNNKGAAKFLSQFYNKGNGDDAIYRFGK